VTKNQKNLTKQKAHTNYRLTSPLDYITIYYVIF